MYGGGGDGCDGGWPLGPLSSLGGMFIRLGAESSGLVRLSRAVSFIPISHVAPCKRNVSKDVPVETTVASIIDMITHPPQATRAQISHTLRCWPTMSASSSSMSCALSSDVGTRTHLPRCEDLGGLLLAPWGTPPLARCAGAPPPLASRFGTRIVSAATLRVWSPPQERLDTRTSVGERQVSGSGTTEVAVRCGAVGRAAIMYVVPLCLCLCKVANDTP